jgi:hypothetical protein
MLVSCLIVLLCSRCVGTSAIPGICSKRSILFDYVKIIFVILEMIGKPSIILNVTPSTKKQNKNFIYLAIVPRYHFFLYPLVWYVYQQRKVQFVGDN